MIIVSVRYLILLGSTWMVKFLGDPQMEPIWSEAQEADYPMAKINSSWVYLQGDDEVT